jgi:lipooligosaccharide transport system ATP-binding protein
MWERLQRLLQQGKAILLTTHFMDEAERLCSRLLVLDHGKKIAEGKPRDLIEEHLEPDVVEVYGQGALAWPTTPNTPRCAAMRRGSRSAARRFSSTPARPAKCGRL